jgi:hypothetical protein
MLVSVSLPTNLLLVPSKQRTIFFGTGEAIAVWEVRKSSQMCSERRMRVVFQLRCELKQEPEKATGKAGTASVKLHNLHRPSATSEAISLACG